MGTDEEAFTTLLAHESFAQLRIVFDEYRKISGKTIEQAVKSEFSGDTGEAVLTIGIKHKLQNPSYLKFHPLDF
jgi:annexin A7/11